LQLIAVLFSFGNKRFVSVIIHLKAAEGYKLHGAHSEKAVFQIRMNYFGKRNISLGGGGGAKAAGA
jgi:hypothetical protein